MPTFAKLHCALHFIFSNSFREWIYKILKGAANLVDGTDYNLKTISLLENRIYFYPFIGIDKLTNEGGLRYHNGWSLSTDRGLEIPH